MKNAKRFSILLIFLFVFISNAQENSAPKLSLDEGSIDSQFEFVIKKSGNYQEYEVIKKVWVNKLRKNVNDSIVKVNKEKNELASQITSLQNKIDGLNTNLNTTNASLDLVSKEKESIVFFGALINKNVYKTIMWGVIGVLLASLLFFIFKFRSSNSITQQAKLSLADLEEEFELHRRRALEREQKLSRQLQDELNKKKLLKK